MTTLAEVIKRCPDCEQRFSLTVISSGNSFGAEFYTDFFVRGPMWDVGSGVIQCPICHHYFWHEDIPTIRDTDMKHTLGRDHTLSSKIIKTLKSLFAYSNLKKEVADAFLSRPSIPRTFAIKLDVYSLLLQKRFWRTEEEEIYIRTRAWWLFNNTYRSSTEHNVFDVLATHELHTEQGEGERPSNTIEYVSTPENDDNMYRLLHLVAPTNPDNCIMRSELFRELGLFDDCLRELEGITVYDNKCYNTDVGYSKIIKRLALKKWRMVSVITNTTNF